MLAELHYALFSGKGYPEINLEIAAASKLSVAHLEGHRHLVIGMELLVEAFATV